MRILHVTPYAPDAWAYGGIPRVVGALTRALARRGHEVTVCATDACDLSARLDPGVSRTADGVIQHVFPNVSNALAYSQQLFLPIGLARFLHRSAGDFDVAHLHACRNVPGVIAAAALRPAGVPYVLAPNGTAPVIERRKAAKRLFDAVLGRGVMRGAERVLAVTEAERRQLRAFGVKAEAIATVPNPIDLDEFAAPIANGRLRRRLELPTEPLVMFLGRQTPRKRVDVLVRAFAVAQGANAHLVIAGNDMSGGSRLRALAFELGVERRTHFVGLLRGLERLEAMKDADVVVYPSEHEAFGLVPLEALLSGAPVIVADDCGCGEVISSVGGGLVTRPGDVAGLASAIDAILHAGSSWRSSAARAAAQVSARYGHEGVADQIELVYTSVIAHASRRSARPALERGGTGHARPVQERT